MNIGQLVRETIALKRALDCPHEWKTHSPDEDRCEKCGVFVTPQGKANLERLAQRVPR